MWDIIKFFPQILYTIEPTNNRLRKALCNDMSHFHYFFESELGYTDVRDLDFRKCKSLLQSHLTHSPLLFYFTNYRRIKGFVRQLK